MKKLITFVALAAFFVFLSPVAFAEDATGASSGGSTATGASAGTSGTATVTGTSATGEPVRMEVEIEAEGGVQVITIKPEGSDDSSGRAMCGGQAQPALECPAGYSIGCNPTGGDHWGCIKSAAGVSGGASAGTSAGSGSGGAGAGKVMNALDEDDDGDSIDTILEDDAVRAAVFIKLGDIKGESEGKAKGNVDVQWKVEEGEKSRTALDGEFQTGDIPSEDDFSIMIDSRKVRGWDPKTKEEVAKATPKLAEAVTDENELALFVIGDSSDDPRMESISLNYTKIEFKYRSDAKLFGLIPSSMLQDVSLEGGAVNLKKPWYSFLFSGYLTIDDIEAAAKKKDKPKPIQIESWSFGASNAGSMASGQGGGSGKVRVAVGDVNGDGIEGSPADFASAFSALSEAVKAGYDLAVQKKI